MRLLMIFHQYPSKWKFQVFQNFRRLVLYSHFFGFQGFIGFLSGFFLESFLDFFGFLWVSFRVSSLGFFDSFSGFLFWVFSCAPFLLIEIFHFLYTLTL
ncbi:unnamed protein product [Rhizophagus irregularis]|nr:unnamed protein product [Rhizophagus irregularis]